jgi:membrane protease YdiL (CAAX protease family)
MIAAGVALAGAATIVLARARGLFGHGAIRPRLIGATLLWAVAAVSLWLAFQQDGFDPSRSGLFTFGWAQIGYGVLFGILGLLAFPPYIFLAMRLGHQPQDQQALRAIASAPFVQRVYLLVTAAGAEEIIFRAVAIGGLIAAGVSHIAAVVIPLLIFVLLHRSSWSALHLIFVAVAGALMTGAFLLGGFWAAVLAHFIVDAPMMLAGSAITDKKRDATGKA